jgi:KRAB domain-containing zinc finger protein
LFKSLKTILFSPPQIEPGLSTSDILSWIKQEEEPQVGAPQESRESDMYKGTYAGK